jgi:arsenate reductase (thioredoxin)
MEATAFNSRAVAALKRVGFEVEITKGENPHDRSYFAKDADFLIYFSKKLKKIRLVCRMIFLPL